MLHDKLHSRTTRQCGPVRLHCLPVCAGHGLHLLQEAIANSPNPRKQKKLRRAPNKAASASSNADPAFGVSPQNEQQSANPDPAKGGLQRQVAAGGQVQVHGVAHQITRAEMDEIRRTQCDIGLQSKLLIEGLEGRIAGLQRFLRCRPRSISWGHAFCCLSAARPPEATLQHQRCSCCQLVMLLTAWSTVLTHPAVQTAATSSRRVACVLYSGQSVTGVTLLTHPNSKARSVSQTLVIYLSPQPWLILVLLHKMDSFERCWCPCTACCQPTTSKAYHCHCLN